MNKINTLIDLKRKAPGEEIKKAEPEDNQMKRTKTQTGNKKQLDADPEINDPFYKSNKVTQQTTESADPDEECVFGEKIYERLKDVTLTDSSDDEKKQPKNQPKKNVSRKETRESFQTKPSTDTYLLRLMKILSISQALSQRPAANRSLIE